MVSFTLSTGFALLATLSSTMALPAATVPDNCNAFYTVEFHDTCSSIVEKHNNAFTAPDLLKWNPYIGNTCFGLLETVTICVGVKDYVYPGAIVGGAIWTAAQGPVPVQPSITAKCNKYEYTDKEGTPPFAQLLQDNGITAEQFTAWNYPDFNGTAHFAWAQYFSCVGSD